MSALPHICRECQRILGRVSQKKALFLCSAIANSLEAEGIPVLRPGKKSVFVTFVHFCNTHLWSPRFLTACSIAAAECVEAL